MVYFDTINKKEFKLTKRIYKNNPTKILNFRFIQNKEDFIVDEIPIKFTNSGNFLILKIKKQNMDTWELLDKLASFLGIYTSELGYVGLKDKNATTTQYISLPKKFSKEIKKFRHKNIEILDSFLHSSKLRIGDLKENNFKINLYEVGFEDLNLIQKRIKFIVKNGLPNYFGYQRFGKNSQENLMKAKELILGERIIKDKKLSKILISAYQSDLFNSWLVQRLKSSKDYFDILDGDIFYDNKKHKLFTAKKINESIRKNIEDKSISPTGLLAGRKVFRSIDKARIIEEKYDDVFIMEKGYRRKALILPQNIKCNYEQKEKKVSLEFSLEKASYATVFIESLANKNFS